MVEAVAVADERGEGLGELLLVEEQADLAVDRLAGLHLKDTLLLVTLLVLDQVCGEGCQADQLAGRRLGHIGAGDKLVAAAEQRRDHLASSRVESQVERLIHQIVEVDLDSGGHVACADRRQGQGVAIDPDDGGALMSAAKGTAGVKRAEGQRVGEAVDGVHLRKRVRSEVCLRVVTCLFIRPRPHTGNVVKRRAMAI